MYTDTTQIVRGWDKSSI